MAATKLSVGHVIFMGSVEPTPPQKLAVVGGGGAADWTTDTIAGSFPGFWGSPGNATVYKADAERTLLAIVKWLTGKSTGANILLMNSTGAGAIFGTEIQTTLSGAGHTYALSGSPTAFGAYDPLAFDCVFWNSGWSGGTWNGVSTGNDVADYILSHGVKILSGTGKDWARYGVTNSAGHDQYCGGGDTHCGTTDGPTNWSNQMPFTSSQLGTLASGGSWGTTNYALGFFNARRMTVGTNTMGGSLNMYNCNAPGHASHSDPSEGVLALWNT